MKNIAATQPTTTDESVTKKVLDHHFQTFQQNDLEGVMTDYTEESIIITPTGTYKGLAEIRNNFINVFKSLPTNGTTLTLTTSTIARDVAYVVWTATTPTLAFKYATDTFVIANGKIVSQTFAGEVIPLK